MDAHDAIEELAGILTPAKYMDMRRPDGWQVTIEAQTFGNWRLTIFEPGGGGSGFVSIMGPAEGFDRLTSIAANLLLKQNPIEPIHLLNMRTEQIVKLLFPDHEPEPQRDEFYRFTVGQGYWRAI